MVLAAPAFCTCYRDPREVEKTPADNLRNITDSLHHSITRIANGWSGKHDGYRLAVRQYVAITTVQRTPCYEVKMADSQDRLIDRTTKNTAKTTKTPITPITPVVQIRIFLCDVAVHGCCHCSVLEKYKRESGISLRWSE